MTRTPRNGKKLNGDKDHVISLKNVKRANRLSDPLSELSAFKQFRRNGLQLELECKKVRDLNVETIDVMFRILKTNMEELYKTCSWGWDEPKKFFQMTEPAAWYLIAKDENKTPLAFSHFRFDMDYGLDVLYIYELQLDESVKRKGLGKFMSQILELIAFKNNMKKVVLTCFKHNPDAVDFYKSMHFNIDETSPEDTIDEKFCYYILSKPNTHLKAKGS